VRGRRGGGSETENVGRRTVEGGKWAGGWKRRVDKKRKQGMGVETEGGVGLPP